MNESFCCDMKCDIAAEHYAKKVIYCTIFHLGVSSLTRHVKNNFISAQIIQHPSFTSHVIAVHLSFLLAANCASMYH